jgi:hypothetical protein
VRAFARKTNTEQGERGMMEKPMKYRAALIGGLVIGFISGIPGLNFINCCCCAGILAGGALAVFFYKKEFTPEMPPMESSDVLILGIIAGIAGALVSAALGCVVQLLYGPVEMEMIRRFTMKFISRLADSGEMPQSQIDQMQSQLDQAMQEHMTIGSVLRSLIFTLVIYPIFSMLGALIGFGLFGKSRSVPPENPPQF